MGKILLVVWGLSQSYGGLSEGWGLCPLIANGMVTRFSKLGFLFFPLVHSENNMFSIFACFAVLKLLYLFSGPNALALDQFEEHNATSEMPTSMEKNLRIHPLHLKNITVIMNSAVNSKTWVSRQTDGRVVAKKELISTVNKRVTALGMTELETRPHSSGQSCHRAVGRTVF